MIMATGSPRMKKQECLRTPVTAGVIEKPVSLREVFGHVRTDFAQHRAAPLIVRGRWREIELGSECSRPERPSPQVHVLRGLHKPPPDDAAPRYPVDNQGPTGQVGERGHRKVRLSRS
jgi:hypothetical protein